jgi:hypothetical protein
MAQIVLTDVLVSIAAIAAAPNGFAAGAVKSVTLNYTPDMLENTGMGHTAKSRKKGLDDWSMDIEIYQDYTNAAFDDLVWALVLAGTTVGAIAIRPTGAGDNVPAVGADNPSYGSTAGIIESYSPIAAGSVGELGVMKLRILAMGVALTRVEA